MKRLGPILGYWFCVAIPLYGQEGGIITTFAGSGVQGYSGDGGPATQAHLNEPRDVTVDANGAIYVADYYNSVVRRIGQDGIITTIAGTGRHGYAGDGGLATQAALQSPIGTDVGADGVVYIADHANHRVFAVGLDGIIRTVAGGGSVSEPGLIGDGGPATQAVVSHPWGVVADAQGNLFVSEAGQEGRGNHIRRVGIDGIITTVAGTGIPGYSGDGGPAVLAQLNDPHGIALRANGYLYVAETGNHCIRRIGPDGTIITIAGVGPDHLGNGGFSGDGGPATQARFNTPEDVAVDASGNIYIADTANSRIRRVDTNGTVDRPR